MNPAPHRPPSSPHRRLHALWGSALLVLTACGGGGGGTEPSVPVATAPTPAPAPSPAPAQAPALSLAAGKVDNQGGNLDGQGTAARFGLLSAVAIDADGNLFLTDLQYGQVRKASAQGAVTTLPVQVAPLNSGVESRGMAVGRTGALYFVQAGDVRKATQDGAVSTLASPLNLTYTPEPRLAVDGADNVYVTTRANDRNIGADTLWKVSGSGIPQLWWSDPAASFSAMAVQADGTAYVADRSSVRKISGAGAASTLAGIPGYFSDTGPDGPGADARFGDIAALAVDRDGTVFVVENTGPRGSPTAARVRRVSPSGLVSSWPIDQTLKPARAAQVDGAGNLYLLSPHHVTRIDKAGHVSVFAGNPDDSAPVPVDGPAAQAAFASPDSVAVGPSGTVLVLERDGLLRRVDAQGAVSSRSVLPPELVGLVPGVDFFPGASTWKLGGVDADGNAYVAMTLKKPMPFIDNIRAAAVVKVPLSGPVTSFYSALASFASLGNFKTPQNLALDRQGNLLVSFGEFGGRMSKFSTSGQSLGEATLPALEGAFAWKANAAGQWLAYGCSGDAGCWIRTASAAGAVLTTTAIPASVCTSATCYLGDLAQAPGGDIYFTNTFGHRVYKVSAGGAVSGFLGKPGSAGIVLGDAPASLYAPRGIDIDSRGAMFVVSDKALLKIQLPP